MTVAQWWVNFRDLVSFAADFMIIRCTIMLIMMVWKGDKK